MVAGLPERYSVVRKIASGGMSEVYLCRLRGEEGFVKKVAVKVIHPRFSEITRFRELFVREARIAASLSHQNLVQVFDFGRQGNSYFLAMEFVDGWNLAQAVAQLRSRAIRIPLPLWRYWMEGMLDGIAYLHSRNIVHRDISPSNVLLTRGGAVKITDFGIARGSRLGQERSEGWEGKFSYMSPEQAGGEDGDESSDLFSAGIVAAEFFLSEKLFGGEETGKILTRLRGHDANKLPMGLFPPPLSEILRKSLAKERPDRYADAGSFARAIGTAVPETISRADLVVFWDRLFPESGQEEEDTVVADVPRAAEKPRMIREKKESYAGRRRRGIRIGVASALASLAAAGMLLWQGIGPAEKETPTDALTETSREVPKGIPRGGDFRYPGGITSPGKTYGPVSRREGEPEQTSRNPEEVLSASGKGEPRTGVAEVPDGAVPEGRGSRPAGKNGTVSEKRGLVWIETDPAGAAVVLEDGAELGATPLRLDAAALSGKKLFFRKEGYVAESVSADTLAQIPRYRVQLERRTGKLEVVQAIPWARVYDGKRYLGVTPISFLELPVGERRLRFVNEPLGVDRVETVTVKPGTNPKLIVPLVGTR